MKHLHLVRPIFKTKYRATYIIVRNNKWSFYEPSRDDFEIMTFLFDVGPDGAEIGEHLLTFDDSITTTEQLRKAYPEFFL